MVIGFLADADVAVAMITLESLLTAADLGM